FAERIRHLRQNMGSSSSTCENADHTILIDLARLKAARKDWAGAEQLLEKFLAAKPELFAENYTYFGFANAMLGFLAEQKGDAAAAQKAWKAGLYPNYVARFASVGVVDRGAPPGAEGVIIYSILA